MQGKADTASPRFLYTRDTHAIIALRNPRLNTLAEDSRSGDPNASYSSCAYAYVSAVFRGRLEQIERNRQPSVKAILTSPSPARGVRG